MTLKNTNALKNDLMEMRLNEAQRFSAFRKMYFYSECPDGEFHNELCAILEGFHEKRRIRFALAAPRGSGKSTIVSLQYIIYLICLKIEPYVALVTHSDEQAREAVANIKQELESNEKLRRDFPDACDHLKHPKAKLWRQKEFVTRTGIKVTAATSGQSLRGKRHGRNRPSLLLIDDLEKASSARTIKDSDKIDEWLIRDAFKAGSPEANVLMLGTIHHYYSILARYTDPSTKPGWKYKITKAILSWSEHPELWDTWKRIYLNQEQYEGESGPDAARKYFEENDKAMLQGTKVFWESRFSYYALMEMRLLDSEAAFDCEMQNEPVNPKDCIFHPEDIHFYEPSVTSSSILEKLGGLNCELALGCDLASSEKMSSDYSAILILARAKDTGVCYVLQADIGRWPLNDIKEKLLGYFRKYPSLRSRIEANNFQKYFVEELLREANKQRLYPIIDAKINNDNKKMRIELLRDPIKNKVILFSSEQHRLLEELRYFPRGFDDGLDALQMAFDLLKNPGGMEPEKLKNVIRLVTGDKSKRMAGVLGILGSGNRLEPFNDEFGLLAPR